MTLRGVVQLLILFTVGADGQINCTRGWFGEDCKLSCHCNQTICSSTGVCSLNNLCAIGYFGPSCQFLNVAGMTTKNPVFLTDYKDITCNPDSHSPTLFFDLEAGISFFWMRLLLKSHETSREVEVRLNEQTHSCANQRVMSNIPNTVDVMCDSPVLVKNLTINGTLVPSICSLEIGAGRNAALYQQTHQSSTEQPPDEHEAKKVVDGDIHTCASTTRQTLVPSWEVTLARPHVLHRVRIYSANDSAKRLDGFTLITYSADHTQVEKYRAPSIMSQMVANVHLFSHQPVTQLQIQARTEPEPDGQDCPDGYYGFYCENICSCRPDEYCDSVTGGCSNGCPSGFYGFQCKEDCPVNCFLGVCRTRSGKCRRCSPGYLGERCTELCPKGTQGDNCSFPCPPNCADGICDSVTGHCFKCQEKYAGLFCTDCVKSHYGSFCSTKCPEHCKDKVCDHTSGKCLACEPSYEGDMCEDFNYFSYLVLNHAHWLYIIAGIIFFLLLMLALVLIMPKSEHAGQEEDDKQPKRGRRTVSFRDPIGSETEDTDFGTSVDRTDSDTD